MMWLVLVVVADKTGRTMGVGKLRIDEAIVAISGTAVTNTRIKLCSLCPSSVVLLPQLFSTPHGGQNAHCCVTSLGSTGAGQRLL